jgi:hemolysin III
MRTPSGVAGVPEAIGQAIAKPLLRGWLHLVCFVLAVPTGVFVVRLAGSPRAQVGAVIYAVALTALFGVSATYHRGRWSPALRAHLQRLDHTTIYVMIAGSYTPVCLLAMRGWVSVVVLTTVWAGAVLGGVLTWVVGRRARTLRAVLYLVLGWVALLAAPQLVRHLSATELALLTIGGVLFSGGSVVLAMKRPDPFPRVFGYHEVWHVFVVAAVVCQLAAIASVIHGAAPA